MPEDNLSIDDFFKVFGYACLYKACGTTVDSIKAEEVTITFVRDGLPHKMLSQLEEYGYSITNPYNGIYYLGRNGSFPIQVIASGLLNPDEHQWLNSLREPTVSIYHLDFLSQKGGPSVVIGKNRVIPGSVIAERSDRSIRHALHAIQDSSVAPFVRRIILYGSCARKEQRYDSDVDLLVELSNDLDENKYHSDVIALIGSVNPSDISLPEVDLKVVVGDDWQKRSTLYFENIRKEGVILWEKVC